MIIKDVGTEIYSINFPPWYTEAPAAKATLATHSIPNHTQLFNWEGLMVSCGKYILQGTIVVTTEA